LDRIIGMNPEYETRTQKLHEIRALGVDPYPHTYHPTINSKALAAAYEGKEVGHSEDAEQSSTPEVQVAGRLVLFRSMGKNAFAHLQDDEGRIQVMFSRDFTLVNGLISSEVTPIKFIEKKLDLGDIIGVKGFLFRTQKGELTVLCREMTLLCKSLLPLPDKHSGLADKGVRYRKRWLDLIANPEVTETFKTRSRIYQLIRDYFTKAHFMEVETASLQNIYGGAEARPFITELNAFHQPMYMRIALEISLKKLIIGGLPRVFEIGKVYRNEGIDRTHNPEFTMMESYAAYWDYNDVMVFTENLFEFIALQLFGTTVIGERPDKEGKMHLIDLKAPWKRLTMKEAIKKYAGVDVDTLSDDELSALLPPDKKASRGKMIAEIFGDRCESFLMQPHHITDHPIETTPLCKLHRNPKEKKERLVERFETFILGVEFCNAYTELNDPLLQRELLEEQAAKREAGDEEASPLDEDFLEAIAQGMPPTGGLGIGLDRLTMLFTNSSSIRDVIYFPLMLNS
jgi:lysyl-tRNA synthetase class 2